MEVKLRFVTSKLTKSGVGTGGAAAVLVWPRELCSDAVLRCAVLRAELGMDWPVPGKFPGCMICEESGDTMHVGTHPEDIEIFYYLDVSY